MSARQILTKLIQEQGPICVSHFMEIALFHPQYGYYKQHDPFGKTGDFVTSPEISQVFGELIGIWCATIWQQMNCPASFILVEMGPGRGTLMADLLRGTRHIPNFHESCSVHMIETSPVLQEIQQTTLTDRHPHITWHTDLSQLPQLPMIFIANELFDALPIRQYVKEEDHWFERRIGLDETQELTFVLRPCDPIHISYERPNGSFKEVSPMSRHIITTISTHIAHYSGAALIIDYGYEEPAYGNTLQALKNHSYHPILEDIGHADITAHVNFTALKQAASKTGVNAYGPISQTTLLESLGIRARIQQLLNNVTQSRQKEELITGVWRLIASDQMGELFKAITLTHPSLPKPIGF